MTFVGDWSPNGTGRRVDDDIVIGNLECAFSDDAIDSDKAYASILARKWLSKIGESGFAAFSLANNHVNDAGNFAETLGDLRRRFPAVQFFGTVDKPYAVIEDDGRQIIVIGCLEPCRSRGQQIFKQENVTALIKSIKQSNNQTIKQFIYVYPHWGMEGEYTRYPSPKQRALAKEWIDAGADGVFGSHSHVPQGREWHHDKPIYYSLGNFDFDHPEGKLYEGTTDCLVVGIDDRGEVAEQFSSRAAMTAVEAASQALEHWNTWQWAKRVGPFNIRKNMASWKIRLARNFIKTLPKFIVWQFLPKTVFFRLAGLWR